MDFIRRHFSYSTYLFHSYVLAKKHWQEVTKYSLLVNLPFIGLGSWLLVENILEHFVRNRQIEFFLSYLLSFSFILIFVLFFLVLPFAHLKLAKKIGSITFSNFKNSVSNNLNLDLLELLAEKSFLLKCFKYNIYVFFLFTFSIFLFFFLIFFLSFFFPIFSYISNYSWFIFCFFCIFR